jgi:hypothetical protein
MRNFSAPALLLAGLVPLLAADVRADGEKPCAGSPPCPSCLHPPAPKVVVELSPPEVVFRQPPPVTATQQSSCLLDKIRQVCHRCRAVPVAVQPAVFQPVTSAVMVQQPAVSTVAPAAMVPMAMPSVAAVPAQPMAVASIASVPTMSALPTVSAVPAMPSVAALPTVSAVPVQGLSFAQPSGLAVAPSGCQSPSGTSSTASLEELTALKIKAQELESRATTAMLQSMRQSMQTQQLALSTLRPSSQPGNGQPGPSATPSSGSGSLEAQVSELAEHVSQLTIRLKSVIDYLNQQKREKK